MELAAKRLLWWQLRRRCPIAAGAHRQSVSACPTAVAPLPWQCPSRCPERCHSRCPPRFHEAMRRPRRWSAWRGNCAVPAQTRSGGAVLKLSPRGVAAAALTVARPWQRATRCGGSKSTGRGVSLAKAKPALYLPCTCSTIARVAMHLAYTCPTIALQLPYTCPHNVLHLPYNYPTRALQLPYSCPTAQPTPPYK